MHLILHVLVPGVVAYVAFGDRWPRAWAIMVATMIVDVDHVLADPVYDPGRCSIGFHPLHSFPAIAAYVLAAVLPKTRLVGVGLSLHMLLDQLDCMAMHGA
jgi:hypothetical protein